MKKIFFSENYFFFLFFFIKNFFFIKKFMKIFFYADIDYESMSATHHPQMNNETPSHCKTIACCTSYPESCSDEQREEVSGVPSLRICMHIRKKAYSINPYRAGRRYACKPLFTRHISVWGAEG